MSISLDETTLAFNSKSQFCLINLNQLMIPSSADVFEENQSSITFIQQLENNEANFIGN